MLLCGKSQRAFITIGNVDIDACEPVFDILEEFVCHLYHVKKTKKVNDDTKFSLKNIRCLERRRIFKTFTPQFRSFKFAPRRTELMEHLLRTWYITKIWKNAHEKDPVGV